jgi:RNA polymerase sigma factor (sigma-70 family)
MLNIENHLNLIRKIVWGYVKSSPGIDFDDLFSEACLECLEYKDKYDPERGNESTFIWQVVNGRLINLLGKKGPQTTEYSDEILFIESRTSCSPEEQLIAEEEWRGILNALSPKSKEICSLVLDRTSPYLPTDKPKTCRGILIKELRKQGWGWTDIWDGFREIKQTLA